MAIQSATKPEGPTGDFKGDIRVDDTPPSRKMLETADGLKLLDEDKKQHTFKDLYAGKGRILVVFIRHFFCGNCQEYTRRLSTDFPPTMLSALSKPTSLIIIGCGSPDLIPMYKRETKTPFPIYADPTRKIYDVLGMTMTLSLGDKEPKYMQQSVLKVSLQSVLQGLRTGRNMLSAGHFWQVGGEFLFESDGAVSWCHRMKNTRDHAELDELRKELEMGGATESSPAIAPGKPVGSRRGTSRTGLARKFSDQRKSWRTSLTRSRHRNTVANGGVPPEAMERLKEEEEPPKGDRDAALAKLTGGVTGNADPSTTSHAVPNGNLAKPAPNGVVTEGLTNGTVEPASDGLAAARHSTQVADTECAKDTSSESMPKSSVVGPNANGNLRNSTPFVQSLLNGNIHKNGEDIGDSANSTIDKTATKEAEVEVHASANGHTVEA